MLEELLELRQDRLEDAPTGVRVGLDDLDDALDLLLEHVTDGPRRRVEAHHTGAHAVDQAARRMVDGREEIGLRHRDAQHGHLQPSEPDTDRSRNGVFGQDALEQQRDDLDRRPLDRRRSRLFQRLLSLRQFLEQLRSADRRCHRTTAARHGETPRNTLLRLADRRTQACRRRRLSRGIAEAGKMTTHKSIEPADHRFGRIGTANQAAGARHHARLVADLGPHVGARPLSTHRFRRIAVASVYRPAPRTLVGVAGTSPVTSRRFVSTNRTSTRVLNTWLVTQLLIRIAWTTAAIPSGRRTVPTRRRPTRVLRATDQRAQVDLGKHAALQQPPIRIVVRLLGEHRQFFVQHRLQRAPVVECQRRTQPGRRHEARQHMGAQDIVRLELLTSLEEIDARSQVGELRRSAIHHRQRQPGAEDLQLDRVVVDQAQLHLAAGRDRQVANQSRWQNAVFDGTAKHRRDRAEPGRRGLVKIDDQAPCDAP